MTTLPKPEPLNPSSRLPKAEAERMLLLLRSSRLPETDVVPGAGWEYGMPLSRLKELKEHWLEKWSFDAFLAEIEKWEHYTVEIEGIELHYIHVKSRQEGAVPLIMTHGWPGSFYEFHKVIGPLSAPSSADQPAFDVIIPSLPGTGFSGPSPRKGWTMIDNARAFNTLMVDVLGYDRYVAQGGDWGSVVTRALTAYHSDHCVLAHFNNMLEGPPAYQYPVLTAMATLPKWAGHLAGSSIFTEFEMYNIARLNAFRATGLGYFAIQSTRPTTIGYALEDSPLGLLSWIGEKHEQWADPEHLSTDDEILNSIALYFLTHTFTSSALPYHENKPGNLPRQPNGKAGLSVFKYDGLAVPRSWAARGLNLTFYKSHDRGGHFAALEMPDALVEDVREFVRGNWKQ